MTEGKQLPAQERDTSEDSAESFDQIRSRLVDAMLVFYAFLFPPLVAASVLRATAVGWKSVFSVQLGVAALYEIAVVARRRLPFVLRAWLLPLCFLTTGLGGIASFGMQGGPVIGLVTGCMFTAAFLGLRAGLLAVGICAAGAAAVGAAVHTGAIELVDPGAYALAPSTWIFTAAALIICPGSAVLCLWLLLSALARSLRRLERQSTCLRGTNARLREEISQRAHAGDECGRLAALVEGASDLVAMALPDGRLTYMNAAGRRMIGIGEKEDIGRFSIADAHPQWANARVREEGIPTALGQGTWKGETAVLTHGGQEIPVSQIVMVHRSPAGDVQYLSTIMREIADRKRAARALEVSERQLRSTLDNTPNVAVQWYDERGRVMYWNPASEKLYGWPAEEALGKTLDALILAPAEAVSFVACLADIAATGGPAGPYEMRFRRRDGSEGVVLSTTFAIPSAEERPIFVCMDVDISERKQVEEELQKLAAVVRYSSELVNLATLDGRMLFLNEAGGRMLGIDPAEAASHTILEVIAEDSQQKAREETLPTIVAQGSWSGELQYRNLRTGQTVDVQANTFVIRNQDTGAPLYLANVSVDITARKRAEESAREQQDMINAIVETSQDWIWAIDADGRHTYSNPAVERILGYRPEEVLASGLALAHPEDRERIRTEWPEWIEIRKGWTNYLVRWRRKDGTYRYMESSAVPILGPDGVLRGFRGVDRDVTERKLQEEELRRKNEEVERFTYTVSHDLRSPLVTIKAFLDLVEKDAVSGNRERLTKNLAFIRNATARMTTLLDELLELSRVGRKVNPPETVPLETLVCEALDLVAGRLNQRGVRVALPDTPYLVRGDRPRLLEVFQNLIDNAVKFMGDEPAPYVEIGVEERQGGPVIFVRDNGLGIDPRHKHKLFGLFEKLHPDVEGTGMGLAMVKRIVECHGGRIWAESPGPGLGTTFYFTLAGLTPCPPVPAPQP